MRLSSSPSFTSDASINSKHRIRLARSVRMLIAILGIFFLCALVIAQPVEVTPVDPDGWAKEQAFFSQRRAEFLDHVKGAKNIVVAKGFGAISDWSSGYENAPLWKIDWKRQQKFCKGIAEVLFRNPSKITFPEPQFSISRDPAEKLAGLMPLAYPTCSSNVDPSGEVKTRKEQQEEIKNKSLDWLSYRWAQLRRYSAPQFIGYEWLYRGEKSQDGSYKPRVLELSYTAGLDPRGCPLWGGRFGDENVTRDEQSKVVLAKIDDEFIFFEFGRYSKDAGKTSAAEIKEVGDWWGRVDQPYVTATGSMHNLNHTLVKGKPHGIGTISGGSFPGTFGPGPYPYGNACVFNFDSSKPGKSDQTPMKSSRQSK